MHRHVYLRIEQLVIEINALYLAIFPTYKVEHLINGISITESMMNIDEKIKAELSNKAQALDEILVDDQGLFDLVKGSFKGAMGRWMILINIVIIAVSAVMVWTGYQFFTSNNLEGYTFWGVCLLLSVFAQVAMKQWVWMEMSRCSLMREIKRVELELAKLSVRLSTNL